MTEEQLDALCAFGEMTSGIIFDEIDGPCRGGIFIESPTELTGYVVIPYSHIRDGVRRLRAELADAQRQLALR
jgi:hypothetical protein